MSIRNLLFWTHLTCGVLAGGVILVMSATGVLLTYQRQSPPGATCALRGGPTLAGSDPPAGRDAGVHGCRDGAW